MGKVCFNCGGTESIELHHIVPLRLGGTNNLSNIVVLCHRCHMAAHHGRHIQEYTTKNFKGGRPHNVTNEELDEALTEFLSGQIGASECKRLLGLSKKTKIGDMSYYKKFLKNKGIKSFRNNIDIIRCKRGDVREGDKVGTITYINGNTENIYFAI